MTQILAHIAVTPAPPTLSNPNGLHRLVDAAAGLARVRNLYCPIKIENEVDGKAWIHPWGKWSRVPWLNPLGIFKMTGMRLDAYKLARAKLPWLCESFDVHFRDGDHIYTGGVPPMPLEYTGLLPYIERAGMVWFDGISANGGTMLHQSVAKHHLQGRHVGAEANRKCADLVECKLSSRGLVEYPDESVPVIAEASQWINTLGRATHWQADDCPPRSAAWFPHGVTTAGDIKTLRALVFAGIGTVIVNFATTEAAGNTGKVFEIARAG